MSNIYHTEPPTQGKVLLKTSYGDIDIELWSKEAPLACRNFIQLSLEGYYDNTNINRIIKDFMVQMGDPTGTGDGGESIWGRPFKDEIHGRIKFNHRGQVAMANENKPNSNHSQFFITLGACEWIDRKHTIFGKVTGNTIFNVLRMGEVEVDGKDRPVDMIKILSVEVLWNPFDDIIPRDLSHMKIKQNSEKEIDNNQKTKKELKAIRDTKLLSFGEEEEELEVDKSIKRGMHSSHDSKIVKDPKLSAEIASDLKDIQSKSSSSSSVKKDVIHKNIENIASNDINDDDDDNDNNVNEWDKKMRLKLLEKRMEVERRQGQYKPKTSSKADKVRYDSDNSDNDNYNSNHNNQDDEKQKIIDRTKEFNKQKENLLRSKRAIQVLTGPDAEKLRKDAAYQNLNTPLEQRRQKYIKRKNEFGNRQDDTLAKLAKFSNKLKEEKKSSSNNDHIESTGVVYNGQVLERDIFEGDDDDGNSWHAGKLKFKKHIDDSYRNKETLDNWETIDPRLKK